MGETARVDGDGGTIGEGHQLSMHPIAVACLLAGFQPYMFHDMLRMKRSLDRGLPSLAWDTNFEHPAITESMGVATNYHPIGWDDIPDKAWDNVSAQLLANLINLLGDR